MKAYIPITHNPHAIEWTIWLQLDEQKICRLTLTGGGDLAYPPHTFDINEFHKQHLDCKLEEMPEEFVKKIVDIENAFKAAKDAIKFIEQIGPEIH